MIFFNFPFGVMLHVKPTFTIPSVSLHHLQVQCIHCKCSSCKNLQIMQKWGLHEAPPKRQFKQYYGISRFGQLNTRKMMTFLVRDKRLKTKNTGTEPINIWFHNKNINLPKCSLFSRKVSYIFTVVLALEFQLAVFSPVSVIFLTDHPSQIHSTEVYPK